MDATNGSEKLLELGSIRKVRTKPRKIKTDIGSAFSALESPQSPSLLLIDMNGFAHQDIGRCEINRYIRLPKK
jgi:hypothetical protein